MAFTITFKDSDGHLWNGVMSVRLVRDTEHAIACIRATLAIDGYSLVTAKLKEAA